MPYMEHMGYYVLMFPLIHITIIWINKGTQNHILDVVDQNTMLNFISWAKSIKLFHCFFSKTITLTNKTMEHTFSPWLLSNGINQCCVIL